MTTQRQTTIAASTMSHAQLLDEYNRLSPTKRNAMFKTKEEAIARINALLAEVTPPVVTTPVEVTPPVAPEVTLVPPVTAKKSKKSKAAPAPVRFSMSRDPKDVRANKANAVIKILTEGGANPRRKDTHAYVHFERMRGGVTIREYLAQFPEEDRNTARRWLYNTVKDGFVATGEPNDIQE